MIKSVFGIILVLAIGAFTAVSARSTGHFTGGKNPPVCTGSQLSVAQDPDFQGDAAMGGQRGDQFVVKNISRRRCSIKGTPGVGLIDRRGRRMGKSISPKSGGSYTLSAGGKATFEIGYHSCEFVASASGRDPKKCRVSRTAQIRFVGVAKVFSVAEKIDADGGVEQVMKLQK